MIRYVMVLHVLQTVFLLPNPLPFLFVSDGAFSSFFTSNFPIFPGRSTRGIVNFLDYVETTDPEGAGHAVETMDASSGGAALLSEYNPL